MKNHACILLVPDALPEPGLEKDLRAALKDSYLVSLLKTASVQLQTFHPSETGCSLLENWWLRYSGYKINHQQPIAAALAGLEPGADKNSPNWYAVPVHLQLGLDHLNLAYQDDVQITPTEARALYSSIASLASERGIRLELEEAQKWKVNFSGEVNLHTSSLAAASGKNIFTWLPYHPHDQKSIFDDQSARVWRMFCHEVQMAWHEHPVNVARESRGKPAINSLWLYGGAARWQPQIDARHIDAQSAIAQLIKNNLPEHGYTWLSAKDSETDSETDSEADSKLKRRIDSIDPINLLKPSSIIELNCLSPAARAQDWNLWLDTWKKLDQHWLGAVKQALTHTAKIEIVFMGSHDQLTLELNRRDKWKIWRQHRLADWLKQA